MRRILCTFGLATAFTLILLILFDDPDATTSRSSEIAMWKEEGPAALGFVPPSHRGRESWRREHPNDLRSSEWGTVKRLLAAASDPDRMAAILRASPDPQELMEAAIDALDASSLAALLEARIGIKPEDIAATGDVYRRAKSLAGAAMRGVLTQEEEEPNLPKASISNMMALTPGAVVPNASSFTSDARKVYATAALEGYTGRNVIAKWSRRDTRELLSMRQHPVEPGAGAATVWMLNKSGWGTGQYVVELFAEDDDTTPLARGAFSIEETSASQHKEEQL